MSLATRCSACGTIFRVVEDQLRVSDGWVRCGRCAEVFDARAQLFDIDREAPPPWPSEATAAVTTSAPMPEEQRAPSRPEPAPASWQEEAPAAAFEPSHASFTPDHTAHASHAAEPELAPDSTHEHEAAHNARFDSRLEPHWSDEPKPTPPAPAPAPSAPAELPSPKVEPLAAVLPPRIEERPDVLLSEHLAKLNARTDTQTETAALPEFLRSQASKTKWHSVKARLALSLMASLLLSGLLLQASLHFRNTLAAMHPKLRPALEAACGITGCTISPRQHIASVGVENSALNQAGPGNHYQLVVGLRNKGNTEVATPWVDVSLTDSAGALVAKRVLGPADFKTDKLAMAAGADLSLQTLLSTGNARVSGYSVEIFYP